MRSSSSIIPLLLVLGSCGSPPKPPIVDESLKRPANSAMAIDLQVCKSDLQNTRILATESSRLAESATATLARASAQQQAIAAAQAATPGAAPAARRGRSRPGPTRCQQERRRARCRSRSGS